MHLKLTFADGITATATLIETRVDAIDGLKTTFYRAKVLPLEKAKVEKAIGHLLDADNAAWFPECEVTL